MTTKEEIQTITDEVGKVFVYISDKKHTIFPESWRFLGKDGKGDCEDFSLTVLLRLANGNFLRMFRWLLTRRAKIHNVKLPSGTRHAVLEIDGYMVENIYKKVDTKDAYLKRNWKFSFHYPVTVILFCLFLGYTIGTVGRLLKGH